MRVGGRAKRILIIHPEGNIYNNPHLYELIRTLRKEYKVAILVPNNPVAYSSLEFSDIIIPYLPKFNDFLIRWLKQPILFRLVSLFFIFYLVPRRFDLIIGIDNIGLILSNILSKCIRIPYGFVSYEIFFASECLPNEKRIEIQASQSAKFIIVQDMLRAKQLIIENQVKRNQLVLMPVASSHNKLYVKDYSLYDEYVIDRKKKIALFVGSISSWTCIDQLVQSIEKLPSDWILLLHDRYGDTQEKLLQLIDVASLEQGQIIFANVDIKDTTEMYRLLHVADIGLSLYCPDFKSKYTGFNLQYVGLSSGKTSTYLQNGVPVITTVNSMLQQLEPNKDIVKFIRSIDEVFEILKDFQPSPQINQACIDFFNRELNFDLFYPKLQEKIIECLEK